MWPLYVAAKTHHNSRAVRAEEPPVALGELHRVVEGRGHAPQALAGKTRSSGEEARGTVLGVLDVMNRQFETALEERVSPGGSHCECEEWQTV